MRSKRTWSIKRSKVKTHPDIPGHFLFGQLQVDLYTDIHNIAPPYNIFPSTIIL